MNACSKNALLVMALLAAPAAGAQRAAPIAKNRLHSSFRAIGMTADRATDSVVVFDASTDSVLGLIPLDEGNPFCYGDSVITSDLSRGYVVTGFGEVWVVDLTTTPPSLDTSGVNPFPITNNGLDIAITADDRFLLVCQGNEPGRINVVDTASRTVVGTSSTSSNWVAVDVAADGSVLTSSQSGDRTRRMTLDAAGQLTFASELFFEANPLNVSFVPGAPIGLLVAFLPGRVRSFTVPEMVPIETLTMTLPTNELPINALGDPGRGLVYIRTNESLQAFTLDAATGDLRSTPLWNVALGFTIACYGVEELALHPDGSKLYTNVPGGVQVVDPGTGSLITMITHASLPGPTGLCVRGVAAELEASLDIKPGACPNSFNPKGHGVLPVALVGSEELDVTQVDITSLHLARADGTGESVAPLEGPPGPHTEVGDVSRPFEGETCDCGKLTGGDGILDLEAKFDGDALVPALGLDVAPPGALVELVLTGELLDGTSFSASDCVRLVPPDAPGGELLVVSTVTRGWIQLSPPDLLLDGGGFGEFRRTYPLGSLVTLLAAEIEGQPFITWEVNGVRQKLGERKLQYKVKGEHAELRAVYGIPRVKR